MYSFPSHAYKVAGQLQDINCLASVHVEPFLFTRKFPTSKYKGARGKQDLSGYKNGYRRDIYQRWQPIYVDLVS